MRRMPQELIEAKVTTAIGAPPYQRTFERTTDRNGHRERLLSTTAGDLEPRIPKLRSGSFGHGRGGIDTATPIHPAARAKATTAPTKLIGACRCCGRARASWTQRPSSPR